MYFHIEEHRAWINSQGHVFIDERDPEYARFASDDRGVVKRMLRIWLAESRDGEPYLRAYLGVISCRIVGPSLREWYHLFHLTSKEAKTAGVSPKELRKELGSVLRKYIEEEFEINQNHLVQ